MTSLDSHQRNTSSNEVVHTAYGSFSIYSCFLWFYRETQTQWLPYNDVQNQALTKFFIAGFGSASFEFQGAFCTVTFNDPMKHYTSSQLSSPKPVLVAFHPSPPAAFVSFATDLGLQSQPLGALKHLQLENQRNIVISHLVSQSSLKSAPLPSSSHYSPLTSCTTESRYAGTSSSSSTMSSCVLDGHNPYAR